jgi:ATP-dependent Clp protease ATP-binding subunit ClpA
MLVAAAKEANMLQHPYIGTEHILLGILREDDDIAAKLLSESGVKVEKCTQTILCALDLNFVGMDENNDDNDFSFVSHKTYDRKASYQMSKPLLQIHLDAI